MGVIVTHICIVTFDTYHLSLPRGKSLYKTFCYRGWLLSLMEINISLLYAYKGAIQTTHPKFRLTYLASIIYRAIST